MSQHFDAVVVGAGLQGSLAVLCLRHRQPTARIALLDRAAPRTSDALWCFHAQDIPAHAAAALEPVVAQRWPGYTVHFPGFERRIGSDYGCVRAGLLEQEVTRSLAHEGSVERRNVEVAEVLADRVTLTDGETLASKRVLDARGLRADLPKSSGYQKFVGLEVVLREPHGLEAPVLMDATVPQTDGFRFLYVLPFDSRRVLVEDTRFSPEPLLDRTVLREETLAYCARRGWTIETVLREEAAVLPMPWAGEVSDPTKSPLCAGIRGGWFHPATGYSLPVAARLAWAWAAPDHQQELQALFSHHSSQLNRAHLLNRLLFRFCAPEWMWEIFARFYRLPEPLIERFYSLTLRSTDMARILAGKPPRGVSLRALVELRNWRG